MVPMGHCSFRWQRFARAALRTVHCSTRSARVKRSPGHAPVRCSWTQLAPRPLLGRVMPRCSRPGVANGVHQLACQSHRDEFLGAPRAHFAATHDRTACDVVITARLGPRFIERHVVGSGLKLETPIEDASVVRRRCHRTPGAGGTECSAKECPAGRTAAPDRQSAQSAQAPASSGHSPCVTAVGRASDRRRS